MKHILCFGDSLTWGYKPEDAKRFSFDIRYPGVLQAQLGSQYKIIENALPGRCTIYDHPRLKYRNGRDFLLATLATHQPIDLVILLLGTNDVQYSVDKSARGAAAGCSALIDDILISQARQDLSAPQILLLSPPHIIKPSNMMGLFFEGSEEESHKFAKYYEVVAKGFNVPFLDTSKIVKPSPIDGIHLDEKGNYDLGVAVADVVKGIMG